MNGACVTCAKHDTCFYSSEKVIDCIRHEPKSESNYEKLFGTPERAARTLMKFSQLSCAYCTLHGVCGDDLDDDCLLCDYDALLEWLRGDVE